MPIISSAQMPAGRLWDCRTGRSIFVLQGHVKQVIAVDFAPDGYHIATGGDDHTVKVRRSAILLHCVTCWSVVAGNTSSSPGRNRSTLYLVSCRGDYQPDAFNSKDCG